MTSHTIWLYSLISVFLVSLVSLIGILTLGVKTKNIKKLLIYLISFSAGTLFGDAFLHLLPQSISPPENIEMTALYILLGITIFLILEKLIHWQHCHNNVLEDSHIHSFAYMNLLGDGLHNFLDGIMLAASYLVSIPAGMATTLAVLLHEIPQEIGDFGVLIHGGFTKGKALLLNFASALLAVLGAILTLLLTGTIQNIDKIIVPISIGGLIYIAGSDLIPEIHKHSSKFSKSLLQIIFFILGIAVMAALLLIE